MIINKTQLGEDWPFTVDEVAFIKVQAGSGIDKINAFAIVHNYLIFTLSGILDLSEIPPLEQSYIWADDPEIPGAKKSLSPLFKFLEGKCTP